MKRVLSSLILIALATAYIACGGDGGDPQPPPPEPTAQEKALELLKKGGGTWNITSVVVGTTDVTSEYFQGMTLKFSDGTLVATGDSPVWQGQDTWSFGDEGATFFNRGQAKGKRVDIVELTADKLVLSLDWPETTTEPARSKSIEGVHVFTFN